MSNRYVSAAERRSEDICPICCKRIKSKTTVWGVLIKYHFLCKDCDLGFAYGYKNSHDDNIKILIIQAICPICHEDHNVNVVGPPDNDSIPCEGCWYTSAMRQATKAGLFEEPDTNSRIKVPNLII